jgi:toxin CcdB
MAQFDVYPNPTVAQREGFPYLVSLQSDQLDGFSTRLVMPLARAPATPMTMPRRLSLDVDVLGEQLRLAAHLCGPVPAKLLKQPVASLRSQEHAIRDALDAVISGV